MEAVLPLRYPEGTVWFVLNYLSPLSTARGASAVSCIDSFNRREETSLKLFCPSFVAYREVKGRKEKIDRPLAYHYTFVRGEFSDIKKLCAEDNKFSFVLNKSGEQRYAVVDDFTMEHFKRVALRYSNNIPFYSLEGVDLQDYDKVEIVDGDFPGLIGYYMSERGSSSGRVILQLSQNLGTVIYDVKAKYVRVIEFSKNFKRVYDIIDAFVPKLLSSMRKYFHEQPVSEEELSALHSFCSRMSICKLGNRKTDAKLRGLLTMAYRIMGNEELRRINEINFLQKREAVTAHATNALLSLIDYVSTRNVAFLEAGKGYLAVIEDNNSKAVERLREEYEYYAC